MTGCTDASVIGDFATGLWVTQLGSPSDVSALTISGWVTQSFTIGALNNYTFQCFSGVSGNVCPVLYQDEFAILALMYMQQFWTYRAQATAGAGGVLLPWTALRDGDSEIRRVDPAALMRTYQSMSNAANKQLNAMIVQYNRAQGGPTSIDFYDIDNTWLGAAYYNGGFVN